MDEDETADSSAGEGEDPTAIRSLAVSPEDVVDAFVYTRENPGTAVLRVTPPFHGRMRARLHVYRTDDTRATGAVHCAPADFLADELVDSYPTLEEHAGRPEAETESESEIEDERDEPDSDPDRIHEAYTAALEAWRERARESIVESVVLEAGECRTDVDVKRVG
ncbi:hypothetical protein [Natronoglomus mannanivorans]|uniref:DUF8009 domain-containing protein n=1 Tax=Natronoglomus mannanivorans TaxID=2979990 RepID=A0AAP2Z1G5_9EURY|nr:hypothetical protein [Halobacteria archaeon AArc-xg1-1]